MNQLRRKFANLWNPSQREDGVQDQQNGHIRRGSNNSTSSSSEVPAALELDATSAASPANGSQRRQRHHGGLGRGDREEEEEEDDAPPRLLSLSHPWGTSDPRPPPGWTSAASRPASQRRALSTGSDSNSLRARPRNDTDVNGDGRAKNVSAAANGHHASLRVVDLGFPATSVLQGSRTTAAAGTAAAGARDSGRRRGRDGDGDDELSRGSASATKRSRAEEVDRHNGGGGGGGGGSSGSREEEEPAAGSDRRWEMQKASRRRRTCPADSTFVSPSAKRVVGDDASNPAGASASVVALAAHEDEEELEHRRSSTPSRLIFSAGFFKVLRGSRAAAKRARSATKLKKKTRESQAAVVRQAFLSAHSEQEGGGDGGGDGGGEREERKEEGVPRRGRGRVRGDDARALSLRDENDEDIWRRINQAEAEHAREAEERAMARVRRLRNLRADALVAFGQAQEARDELVSTAKTALDAAGGADMATLRSLFAAGGGDSGSSNPSSRFKGDEEVSALLNKYSALEAVLENIKAVKGTGDTAALEAALASEEAKSVQNQPEVLSAFSHLRTAREEAEKTRAKKEAQAARDAAAAATAAAEAAKAQQEKDKAAALASTLAAERSTAAAAEAAKAVLVAAQKAQQGKAEEEAREVAETAQAAASGAAAAGESQFAERAKVLKAAVESRRAGVDEIFTSSDPGVKRIRMAFKKSYQGCLNKLSATPSTVQQVTRDIKLKADTPLVDARRAGWEAKAKEFLYFNLADKLVDYSERDHFSGDSYRMAFPLASVAVDLMAEHPGLSDLFLGTLYLRCPSAIPALSFDTAGLSDGEVMAALGQMGGEDLPAFLNRTKGLVVLMAAVMQTPAHGGATPSHPLPLSQGWCWLARFVNGLAAYIKEGNAPPVPTGPVLEWFLKVAGFELQRRYGRAFDKVVQTIKVEVLPILLPKAIVPHLLDVVMEDYEGRGRRFLPPAGRDKEFRHFRAWGDT